MRPLGRPRYKWEDCIKVDFKVIVSGIMDCIHLMQERD
jgi:hypothetical protein